MLKAETIQKNIEEIIEYLEKHPWIVEAYNGEMNIKEVNCLMLEELQLIMLLRRFIKLVSNRKIPR